MRDCLFVLRFFIQIHAKFAAALVSALALFYCVFWYGGFWDTIIHAEKGYRNLQLNSGTLGLACIYALAAYIAFCFRETNPRSLFLQLPVGRSSLYLAPFILAWLGSAILYALFEPAWRLGFLGFGVPTSYFLLFVPFLTIVSILSLRRLWLALALPVLLAFLYYYLHFYWLSAWFFYQSQLPSEGSFLAATILIGLVIGRVRFLKVLPLAAAVPLFMAGVTLSRSPANYMEAAELLAFQEQPLWIEKLRKFAQSQEAWAGIGQRYAVYEDLKFRAVDYAERILTRPERSALLKNVVQHAEAFRRTDDPELESWFPVPLVASLVSEGDSAFLRQSGAPERLVCQLLPESQSWENLVWKAKAANCTPTGLRNFLPGSNDAASKRLDTLLLRVLELASYRNSQYLIDSFFMAQGDRKRGVATGEDFRSVASAEGVRPAVWEAWKQKAWKARSGKLLPLLSGGQQQIRDRLETMPMRTRKECDASWELLYDLCTRLGSRCVGRERFTELASFRHFVYYVSHSRSECSRSTSTLWQIQEHLLDPDNLQQLEDWGKLLEKEPGRGDLPI